jgi:PEP-CTERM motif
MRISGLLGAVIAVSMLTPIAPAHADISAGDLMSTDLFRWQGQDGTPTWREILANFDGTEELTFYLWNVPSPPPPVVIPATTPVIDPVVAASSANPSGGAVDGDATSSVLTAFHQGSGFDLTTGGDGGFVFGEAVPEPSAWAMMLLGFAGLASAGYRQAKRASPARA